MSGPYGEPPRPDRLRRPHPEDPTVEFPKPPVPPRRPAPPPPRDDEPWWRNVNREPGVPRPTYRPPPPLPPQGPAPRPPVPAPSARTPRPHPSAPTTPSPAKRSVSPVWIAVGAAVVLVGGAALGVGLSSLNPVRDNVLDVSTVEDGVAAVLRDPVDGYGVYGLTDVTCNGGKDPAVTAGAEFRCEVVVDGRTRSVLAVFQDDAGTYAVDRPR